jgi:hypothetical protein
LKQDGAKLTGIGGTISTEQYPVLHGVVAGDSVKFDVNDRKTKLLYDLERIARRRTIQRQLSRAPIPRALANQPS